MDNGAVISFELLEKVGPIGVIPTGWIKEVNIISWNGGPTKYDIRDWSPDHDRMSKGITMSEMYARELAKVLTKHFEELDAKEDYSPNDTPENR